MSFDPVEIEIRMRQNVDEESKKASQGMSDVGKAAQTAKEEVAESIAIQKQVIQQLKAELEPLAAAFKKANTGTQDPAVYAERKKLLEIVREMKTELKAEEDALISLENQTTKFTAKTANLEVELRNTRNEMGALKLAGQQESAQYKELEQRLGVLGTAYKELTEKQKALSTGGTQMAGFISGINALSGALTAGAGAMGLFNNDSEKMQEIQTRVQSLMAITIGLQQISNTLHSTSAFRLTTVTKVNELWAAANLKVATTLGISNVAAKALMATLTLGLSVAITAAIFLIDRYVTNSRKAAEETKKFNDSIADSAAETMTKYELLRREYIALGDDIKGKEKLLRDQKKDIDNLGIAMNGVVDADNAFITNTEAVKRALMERAKALAASQLAAEKYKEIIQKELVQAEIPKTITRYGNYGAHSEVSNPANEKSKSEIDKANAELAKLVDIFVDGETKFNAELAAIGLSGSKTIIDNSKASWEERKKLAQDALDAMTDMQKGSPEWNAELAKLNEADARLKNWDFSKKEEKKVENEKAKATEKLRLMAINTEEEIAAVTIAAMQDGSEKKLAEVKADYEKRMNMIREKRLELTELEKATGTPATVQRKQLDILETSGTAKYTAANKAINDAAAYEIAKVWDEVDTRFRTALDNQLADVDRYYAEQLAKLKANITSKAQLEKASALLEKKRLKERTILQAEADMAALVFQEEIDLRKQDLAKSNYKWETDHREALLKIQVESAKKQLQKQREIQQAGGDNQKQIDLLIQKLKELGVEIESLPTSKFNEISNTLTSALLKMSGVGGEVGGMFSSMASGLSNVTAMMDVASSKTMTSSQKTSAGISTAISSIVEIYTIVANQIERNKEKQEEWNASIREAAHQARLARIELEAYKESNLFGIENPYARAIAGALQYGEAMKALSESALAMEGGQVQTGTRKVVSGGNTAGGMAAGASAGAAIGGIATSWSGPFAIIGAAVGAIVGGLVGLFAGKKKVPVFESLKQQYGEIFDSETFELNPRIIQDYAKLDAATKDLVDNWDEIKTKAKEAQAEMTANFKDLAGDIGTDLSSALVNAFRNGDVYSAMDDFHGSMTKIIEDIVSQLIFSTYFQALFDELEKKFNASFGLDEDGKYVGGGDGDIIDDIMWFNDAYAKQLDGYNAAMTAADAALTASGYDVFEADSQSGTSKALAQASQDSIDELSGRILAISRNVADMRNGGIEAMFYHREASNYRKLISSQLDALIVNSSIGNDFLNAMRDTLDDINTRGVKIKV